MSAIRLKLTDYLNQRGLSREALTEAIAPETLSQLVREETLQHQVDLSTLAAVVEVLRQLTGEQTNPGDLLEFVSTVDENQRESSSVDSPSPALSQGRKISLSEAKNMAQQAIADEERRRNEFYQLEAKREIYWEDEE